MGYLDRSGLTYFWQKIKAAFYTKSETDAALSGVRAEIPTAVSSLSNDSGYLAPVKETVAAGKTAVLTFTTDRWAAIIMARGGGTNQYGYYLCSGFGAGGTNRYILNKVTEGSSLSASVSGQTIRIANTGTYTVDVSALMLMGSTPTITVA